MTEKFIASPGEGTASGDHESGRKVVSAPADHQQLGDRDWLAEQMFLEKWKKKQAQEKLRNWKHRAIMRGSVNENPDCLNPEYLMEAFGSDDPDFIDGLAQQLLRTFSNTRDDALSFAIAVIKSIEPKEPLEAMLAAQMCAIHEKAMRWSKRLESDEVDELIIAERVVSKLTKNFALQMETLKRYRMGGERKITVQHVSVNDGGKAIVGNVNHSAGDRDLAASPGPALTDARQPAMEIIGEIDRLQGSRSDAEEVNEQPRS